MEDELVRDPSLVGNLYLGSTSPTLSRNLIPGPDQVSALILALIPAPAFTDKLFKKFMKAYLESNQVPRQSLAERKWLFKAKVLEVYYGKSHMDCYYFCQ